MGGIEVTSIGKVKDKPTTPAGSESIVQRLVMWLQYFWMEGKARRYEKKLAGWHMMIKNNEPFADFYREWADELQKKLTT